MRRLLTVIVFDLAISPAILACSGDDDGTLAANRSLSSRSKAGVATFYDADGTGHCSFDKSPHDLDVTAVAMPEYNGSAACGACLVVTGSKGDVTVRVVDSCPGCRGTGVDLDLSMQAFAKIADPKQGRVDIRYRMVPCATTGNVAYHFKEGSSKYWTAIQIRNHRVPIATLEYRKNDTWVPMNRADYNYFVEASGVGDHPGGLTLRVTATDGQIIEETLAGSVEADNTVTGTKQFE